MENQKIRIVDKSKNSNVKCEHCEHWKKITDWEYRCDINGKKKNYWNRCKNFEWMKTIQGKDK